MEGGITWKSKRLEAFAASGLCASRIVRHLFFGFPLRSVVSQRRELKGRAARPAP